MAENQDDKSLIVSSNSLIEAKYNFSLWQKRIFVFMVNQIQVQDKDFRLMRFNIKDIMNFFQVKSKEDYRIIRQVPEDLYNVSMKTPYISAEGNKRWKEVRVISQYTRPEDMAENNAYIELKFNDDLKPHLIQLRELFTKYEIKYIIGLRSVYSFRIYEILKSRSFLKGVKEISVDELKEVLDVEDKYKLYADFKRKIVMQAQKELTAFCDITFTIKEKKQGKKVTSLEFTIHPNVPKNKFNSQSDKNEAPENTENEGVGERGGAKNVEAAKQLFSKIKKFGISEKVFLGWVKNYPFEHLEDCVNEFLSRVNAGKLTGEQPAKQGGYLRVLIEKADFSNIRAQEQQKQAQKHKLEVFSKIETAEKNSIQEQKRAAFDREIEIARYVLATNDGLLEEITAEINREKFSEYQISDFETAPIFRVGVLAKVKARFSGEF